MTDQLKISLPKNLKDTGNATFSQALEGGLTHSDWLDGRKTSPCGQGVALASHSVLPEKAKELMTTDTFGPLFDGLSLSAGLQQFLGNKLRQKLGVNGSPEYVLTWKRWDMCSGPPICALRASVRRTSGQDCFGWPTPVANDDNKSPEAHLKMKKRMGERDGSGANRTAITSLQVMAKTLVGWPTPAKQNAKGGKNPKGNNGNYFTLQTAAGLSGWPTPREGSEEYFQTRNKRKGFQQAMSYLESCAEFAILGQNQSLPNAETEKAERYLLNPLFSLWLQGYPKEWAYCVVPEIQSILG